MTWTQPVQRIAERLIRVSCRRLPEDERAEHCREWSAELPAILDDTSVRPPVLRAVRALRYAAGAFKTTRYLRRTGGSTPRARTSGWRDGAIPVRPAATGSRLAIGVIVWLVAVFAFVSLVRVFPQPPGWPIIAGLALAAAFDAFCLADIARASQVRYLPKWAWALICLAQTPGGGIVYLCVGRVGRARSASPSPARQP
jgi:Phospholipase_D-nuclease N-terminal